MTDSENSQPQDDSDDDIYKDIPEFNFEDELAKLEGSKETYKQEASDLSEKVKALTEENKELKKSNEVLKRNLSTLLKTAQAEVQRKDSMIEELRNKVDSFTFKRNKKPTNDKFTSTNDLIVNFLDVKKGCEKEKSDCVNKIRSKSYENRTSSDSERKSHPDEEKKSESVSGKEKNSNRDNDRRSSYHRENTKSHRQSEKNRDSRNDRHKERKSTKYEENSNQKRSFRESHRDYLLYDSYDKKRHSRSSDNRFLSRRRSSRERRRDNRNSVSSERRSRSHRVEECGDRSRRDSRRDRKESKESSPEKLKARSSVEKDVVGRSREESGGKCTEDGNGRKKTEGNDKKRTEGGNGNGRNKQNKEKSSGKNEKRKNVEIFSTKSPLDALYNDMVASRNSNRFLNSKPGSGHADSDLEEGELFPTENEPNEDWELSFKNGRKSESKPMTIYSKRMMEKFGLESKQTERDKKIKRKTLEERKIVEKSVETEKEPGELTDDENIIESSKEFQELTKVAAIESEIIEKPETKFLIESKNPTESIFDVNEIEESAKNKEESKTEKVTSGKEEPITCRDIESIKETGNVIEFSPFKNNYKLIEISPLKPGDGEHVLNFYSRKTSPKAQKEATGERKVESEHSSKPSDTSEENPWKFSSSENNPETELKIISQEKEKEMEKTTECQRKESVKNIEGKDEKKGKKRSSPTEERGTKRKRKTSDPEIEKSEPKKPKMEKSGEALRKNTRSKRNSKSDGEEKQKEEITPVRESENQIQEDISSYEFFKPITRTVPPETTTDALKMDYKMAATSVIRMETPNKCVSKVKNSIKEQISVFEPKKNSQFSPLIGSKFVEMTPRRMLKNDLMLTDSEDDSIINKKTEGGEEAEEVDGEEEEEEQEGDMSGSEYSECDSDSGASDFVDML